LRIVRLPGGETVADLEGHSQNVESVAFSKDGKLLASGAHDNSVRIWRRTGDDFQLHLVLPSRSRRVKAVRFNAAGDALAVLAEPEHAVRLWRFDTLKTRAAELGIDR
jgi:WD40 repeat protein